MGSINEPEYDAIVVGAGFSGCHILKTLRERGYKVLVLDNAGDLGGVWWWNRYPGARVDSKVPLYEFSNKDLWSDWTWTEKYPGQAEILEYFKHVEEKLHLKKDIKFNTLVETADFDGNSNKWTIKAKDGEEFTARNFILAIGSFSVPYIPKFDGLDTFAGFSSHSSKWPHEGIDYKGKRIAVVGNGSTGVQTIQTVGPVAKSLVVFQKSPTYALPMRQTKLTEKDQDKSKYEAIYEKRKHTFAGLDREFNPGSAIAVSEEEREKVFEELWKEGGLAFWLQTYVDVISNKESNAHAYAFWRKKVLQRIKDPKMAEILAPEVPPYFFGTKRATVEQAYFEVYNQDNVTLIDAKTNKITKVVPEGIITQDGVLHELDIIILATGFDVVTGGILAIDIKGLNGQTLKEKWSEGTWTTQGLMTVGFPNLFFSYGPQGPTTFCNGPTCAEVQGEWISNTLDFMRENGYTRLNTDSETEKKWKDLVEYIGNKSLVPLTDSEYIGTNIPGKPKEMLNFLGGLELYTEHMNQLLNSKFAGFEIQ